MTLKLTLSLNVSVFGCLSAVDWKTVQDVPRLSLSVVEIACNISL